MLHSLRFFLFLLIPSSLFADKSVQDCLAELEQKRWELGAYFAEYEGLGPKGKVRVLTGQDGVGLFYQSFTLFDLNNEKVFELLTWSTEKGAIMIRAGDETQRLDGIKERLEAISAMSAGLCGAGLSQWRVRPYFYLEGDMLIQGASTRKYDWQYRLLELENVTMKKTPENLVVFHSDLFGDLTANLKTGFLVSQTIGERNIGLGKFETEGAAEKIHEMIAAIPVQGFERLVTKKDLKKWNGIEEILLLQAVKKVENGKIALADLQKALVDNESKIASTIDYGLLKEDEQERQQKVLEPLLEAMVKGVITRAAKEADIPNEKADAGIRKIFADPIKKSAIRNAIVTSLCAKKPENVMKLGFNLELKSEDESGKEAIKAIQETLVRAYWTAGVDRAIRRFLIDKEFD